MEPGGGAVRFQIGRDIELYADAEALAKISALAAEAVTMAREAAADKCGRLSAPLNAG